MAKSSHIHEDCLENIRETSILIEKVKQRVEKQTEVAQSL